MSLLLQLALPLGTQFLDALFQFLERETRLGLAEFAGDQLVLEVSNGVVRGRFSEGFLVLEEGNFMNKILRN